MGQSLLESCSVARPPSIVDSISYVNKAKKGKDDPPFPVNLPAQTYLKRDYLYSELKSHAGKKPKIRFEVQLTNGKHVKSRWIKLRADLSKPH